MGDDETLDIIALRSDISPPPPPPPRSHQEPREGDERVTFSPPFFRGRGFVVIWLTALYVRKSIKFNWNPSEAEEGPVQKRGQRTRRNADADGWSDAEWPPSPLARDPVGAVAGPRGTTGTP
ncbi:hypothetical protein MUK42_34964, partial [Musa troglodytarum]